ncbi:type I-B CRISPR-associated protein Cas8b/Csh1 [Clostridium sporogenes]|nr:type I-B CRISPR-associated protein Cas8b/Csh1 [Clostridium sporogenes]
MLKDCLAIFKTLYEKEGNNLILKDYKLGFGDYILVNSNGEITKNITVGGKSNYDLKDYNYFKEFDYLSNLISMQKPIDNKKVIHSNNYLSFFIRKESLQNGKLKEEIIDNYYKILDDPKLKYKTPEKKNALLIYKDIEKKYSKPNTELLSKNKEWVKRNIFNLLEKLELKKNKTCLKIFFDAPIEKYRQESERYIFPNIFNNVKYNIEIEESIYGASDNNVSLNSKKPFLLNKTRKNPVPYLIELKEALLQKKFFDFLSTKISNGRNIIYLSEANQFYLKEGEILNGRFNGLFLKLETGIEPKIIDFDIIPNYNPKIKEIEIDGKIIKNKSELLNIIDTVYFGNQLKHNIFSDDIKLNNYKFKNIILCYKDVFINYFYKGNELQLKNMWHKISKEIIKLSIVNGYIQNAKQQEKLKDVFFK